MFFKILRLKCITNNFVQQTYTLHSFVNVLRVELREIWHTGEHHSNFVARLRIQLLRNIKKRKIVIFIKLINRKKPLALRVILPLALSPVLKSDELRDPVKCSSTTACYCAVIQSCRLAPFRPAVSKGNLTWTSLLPIYRGTWPSPRILT